MTPSTAEIKSGMVSNSSDSLGNLYQEIIVDHARRPRSKGRPPNCRYCQEGKNPLCGDEITIFCELNTNTNTSESPTVSLFFEGSGCSISMASASMMCEQIKNISINDARKIIMRAEEIYTGKKKVADAEDIEDDLEALSGVAKFPVRVKCAALAWKSLELLLAEHFDERGQMKENDIGCDTPVCNTTKRLKVVGTEKN